MSKINKDDMSALFSGLTTPNQSNQSEETVVEVKAISKKSVSIKEKVCANISSVKMDKVRAIAGKEGLSITSILEVALDMAIKSYEDKNGVVRARSSKRGDASKIFL